MKIIQSFAQHECSPYGSDDLRLNFYSFLLSFLTLKKYYGSVTMYCNKEAYQNFIKYIPYDQIFLEKNKYSFAFWNLYKVQIISQVNDDLIHVDSDVFIFDYLFDEFINKDYDILVQDLTPPLESKLAIGNFVNENEEFLRENDIINLEEFNGKFTSCGTLGFKKNVKDIYVNAVEKIYQGILKKEVVSDRLLNIMAEELTVNLVALHHNLKMFPILSEDLILKYGKAECGNIKKYTHLWYGNKFKSEYIQKIKSNIKKNFPEYYQLIEQYEKDILKTE